MCRRTPAQCILYLTRGSCKPSSHRAQTHNLRHQLPSHFKSTQSPGLHVKADLNVRKKKEKEKDHIFAVYIFGMNTGKHCVALQAQFLTFRDCGWTICEGVSKAETEKKKKKKK